MSEKYVPLVEWYKKALLDEGIHLCTAMDLTSVDPEDLFTQRNSLVFIKEYFESLRSNEALKNPAHKFFEILGRITEFRAQHTVSSFLLGIVIKEELSLDVRDWIRVHGNNSPDASFGFLSLRTVCEILKNPGPVGIVLLQFVSSYSSSMFKTSRQLISSPQKI